MDQEGDGVFCSVLPLVFSVSDGHGYHCFCCSSDFFGRCKKGLGYESLVGLVVDFNIEGSHKNFPSWQVEPGLELVFVYAS